MATLGLAAWECASDQTNSAAREFALEPLNKAGGGIVRVGDAKEQLILRVVLPAEGGEVLIRQRIQLEKLDGRFAAGGRQLFKPGAWAVRRWTTSSESENRARLSKR
jgi:hypothetical protein